MSSRFLPPWMARRIVDAERWLGRVLFTGSYERGRRRMLLVIGHMRTGSSLLAHILFSHREIMGYGETHRTYRSVRDFGAVTATVCRRLRRLPLGRSYVLDKILHKHLLPQPGLLRHRAVRTVFILRRPETALSSMVRTESVQDAAKAYEHYMEQLSWIRWLSERLSPEQWSYTSYRELVEETPTVFDRLERFLELSAPLSERYETTYLTGMRKVGDPGPHIESKRIKRNIDREPVSEVQEFVPRARQHFERCLEALREEHKSDPSE